MKSLRCRSPIVSSAARSGRVNSLWGLLLGAGAALAVAAVGLSLVPVVEQRPGPLGVAAAAVPGVLAAGTRLRAYLLPIVLGAAAFGYGLGVSWQPVGFGLAPVAAGLVGSLTVAPAVALAVQRGANALAGSGRAGAPQPEPATAPPTGVSV